MTKTIQTPANDRPVMNTATAKAVRSIDLEAVQKKSPTTTRLFRLKQVLELIPVSRSAWFAGIQTGRYPPSYSLGPRTTVWLSHDIDEVIRTLPRASAPQVGKGICAGLASVRASFWRNKAEDSVWVSGELDEKDSKTLSQHSAELTVEAV